MRETVYVQSKDDDNHDGRLDLLATDIIRPEGTTAGLKVPVVYEDSPYYATSGRGMEDQRKAETGGRFPPQKFPLAYDNLLVPRGYAVILQDTRGTRDSEGCPDPIAGPEEVRDGQATIDWLTGHGQAFRADGTPAAASWSSGHVAMVGKSYDGALALATASTGEPGLDSVVSIAGPSSYYGYTAEGGLAAVNRTAIPSLFVPSPSTPGDGSRPGSAANKTARASVCKNAAPALLRAADATGGSYGAFDAARETLADAKKVRASVWIVQGLYDTNVHPSQGIEEWLALKAAGIHTRLWLHQYGHADPFDFRRAQWLAELPRWLDATVKVGPADTDPAVEVELLPGHWQNLATWPSAGAATIVPLAGQGGGVASFVDDPNAGELEAVTATTDASRIVLRTDPLTSPLHLSGQVSLTLTVALAQGTAPLSAYLVEESPAGAIDAISTDDGTGGVVFAPGKTCVGQGTASDSGCFRDTRPDRSTARQRIITAGHLDAAHRLSLSQPTALLPGQPTTLTINLQPVDVTVPTRHDLAIVIAGSDAQQFPSGPSSGAVRISLPRSGISLPIVTPSPAPAFQFAQSS